MVMLRVLLQLSLEDWTAVDPQSTAAGFAAVYNFIHTLELEFLSKLNASNGHE